MHTVSHKSKSYITAVFSSFQKLIIIGRFTKSLIKASKAEGFEIHEKTSPSQKYDAQSKDLAENESDLES